MISEQDLNSYEEAAKIYSHTPGSGICLRLVEEIRRLRSFLEKIANIEMNDHFNRKCIDIAKEALK